MGLWVDRVVPHLTDRALSGAEVASMRRTVCAGLAGRVLEIGFGSGLNLPCLPPAVVSLDAVEPSDVGWRLSERRRAAAAVPVRRVGLDGRRLDVPDASYDAVLATFTLCTIPDPALALAEVRRALRPGGSFCFLEHGLARDARVARWQRRLDPCQRTLCGGCHLSRDVPGLVAAAGLVVEDLRPADLPGPALARPWTHGFLGRAARSD